MTQERSAKKAVARAWEARKHPVVQATVRWTWWVVNAGMTVWKLLEPFMEPWWSM